MLKAANQKLKLGKQKAEINRAKTEKLTN